MASDYILEIAEPYEIIEIGEDEFEIIELAENESESIEISENDFEIVELAEDGVEIVELAEDDVEIIEISTENDPGLAILLAALQGRIDDIERALESAQLQGWTTFAYNGGGDLTEKRVYEDQTEAVQLFQVDYEYTGGILTTKTVERLSDSAIHVKTYGYSGGNLISIEVN